MLQRRGFIFGLTGALAFPAIVQASSLMPISAARPKPKSTYWKELGVYITKVDLTHYVSSEYGPHPWFAPAGYNTPVVFAWGKGPLPVPHSSLVSALDRINARRLLLKLADITGEPVAAQDAPRVLTELDRLEDRINAAS